MKSLKWYLYFFILIQLSICRVSSSPPFDYLLLSTCFSVFTNESFRHWSTYKSIVHNFISLVVSRFYGYSKWKKQPIVHPIPTVNTLNYAVEEQIWRTHLFELHSTCKQFRHDSYTQQHILSKLGMMGGSVNSQDLWSCLRDAVKLPALSFSVQLSMQCVPLPTLQPEFYRTEDTGYYACSNYPAFWSCLDSRKLSHSWRDV